MNWRRCGTGFVGALINMALKNAARGHARRDLSLSRAKRRWSRADVQVQSRLLHSYQPDIKCIVYFNLPRRRGSVAFMCKRVHALWSCNEKSCCITPTIIEGKKEKKKRLDNDQLVRVATNSLRSIIPLFLSRIIRFFRHSFFFFFNDSRISSFPR